MLTPVAPVEPGTCACDSEALAKLQRRVDLAERKLAQRETRRAIDAATEPRPAAPEERPPQPRPRSVPSDGPDDSDTTKFVAFDVPESGVSVSQNDSGALSVTNTNAALAGKRMTVTARSEDGETREMSIIVPPAP